MEKKTFIDKIKDMFSEVEQSNDEEVKMIYYTTKEGVEVKIPEGSELAEGTPIVVVTEEGETPAPAGEHIIEDKVITVDEAGVIVSVADVEESVEEEATEEVVEEEMSTEEATEEVETPEIEAEVEETLEASEEEVEAEEKTEEEEVEAEEDEAETKMREMEEKIKALEDAIVNMTQNFAAVQTELDELKGKPADDEIKLSKASKTNISKNNNMTARLKDLAKYRNK